MSIADLPNDRKIAQAKAALGVTSKRAKRDSSLEAQNDVGEARKALAAAKLEAHIAEVVAASPPLDDRQRQALARLLQGGAS